MSCCQAMRTGHFGLIGWLLGLVLGPHPVVFRACAQRSLFVGLGDLRGCIIILKQATFVPLPTLCHKDRELRQACPERDKELVGGCRRSHMSAPDTSIGYPAPGYTSQPEIRRSFSLF